MGVDCFLWIEDHSLTISIAVGKGIEQNYDVTNKDFEKCLGFEQLLIKQGLSQYTFHRAKEKIKSFGTITCSILFYGSTQ